MSKLTKAILWSVFTIILAIIGFSGYADGSHYMSYFGIKLSEGGFAILIVIFLLIDLLSIISAIRQIKNEALLFDYKLPDGWMRSTEEPDWIRLWTVELGKGFLPMIDIITRSATNKDEADEAVNKLLQDNRFAHYVQSWQEPCVINNTEWVHSLGNATGENELTSWIFTTHQKGNVHFIAMHTHTNELERYKPVFSNFIEHQYSIN